MGSLVEGLGFFKKAAFESSENILSRQVLATEKMGKKREGIAI